MSSPAAERILEHLRAVAELRALRAGDPRLSARVLALKTYQARRFERTYADLLADGRYGPPARFFLEELYGPQDFTDRDAQFERIVPGLVRLFPHEIIETVQVLGELHALSERLDDTAARHLPRLPVTATGYVQAWQATGQPALRQRQIAITLEIGQALDRYTRSRLLRSSLRMMRGPAKVAGVGVLQHFLETGFDAFGEMKGASEFLGWVAERERALAEALFAPDAPVLAAAMASADGRREAGVLGQLP